MSSSSLSIADARTSRPSRFFAFGVSPSPRSDKPLHRAHCPDKILLKCSVQGMSEL